MQKIWFIKDNTILKKEDKNNSVIESSDEPNNDEDDGNQYVILNPESEKRDNRVIVLTGEINEVSVGMTINQIMFLAQQSNIEPIYLVLSTYGGNTDDMFSLYDIMKFIECPIHTIGLGKVMSAGVLLLSAGTKGERRLGKRARIMIHPIKSQTTGNIFEISNELNEFSKVQKQFEKCLKKETKFTSNEIKNLMGKGFDSYITAEKALKYGIVDKLI